MLHVVGNKTLELVRQLITPANLTNWLFRLTNNLSNHAIFVGFEHYDLVHPPYLSDFHCSIPNGEHIYILQLPMSARYGVSIWSPVSDVHFAFDCHGLAVCKIIKTLTT